MSLYQNLLTMTLAAASANNIALSQTPSGAGNLTLNGSTVTGGVATLDFPRRILLTSGGDDHLLTAIITGTGLNGLALSESIAGGNPTSSTVHDFKTVTSIHISGATASTITAGTNGVGSSVPVILDTIVNPASYGAAVTVTGTVNYTVEMSYDDFSPAWDLNANTPVWFPASGFSSQTTNQNGTIAGPCSLIRLTVNSGTGTASMKLIKPLIAGPF